MEVGIVQRHIGLRRYLWCEHSWRLEVWGCRDIQHNDTQHNDTQRNDPQLNGLICNTQLQWHSSEMTLSIMALEIKCCYAEYRYAECHYAEFHYAGCRCAKCRCTSVVKSIFITCPWHFSTFKNFFSLSRHWLFKSHFFSFDNVEFLWKNNSLEVYIF